MLRIFSFRNIETAMSPQKDSFILWKISRYVTNDKTFDQNLSFGFSIAEITTAPNDLIRKKNVRKIRGR